MKDTVDRDEKTEEKREEEGELREMRKTSRRSNHMVISGQILGKNHNGWGLTAALRNSVSLYFNILAIPYHNYMCVLKQKRGKWFEG